MNLITCPAVLVSAPSSGQGKGRKTTEGNKGLKGEADRREDGWDKKDESERNDGETGKKD